MLVADHLDAEARARAGAGEILPSDFLDRSVNGKAVSFTLPDGSTGRGAVESIEHDERGIHFVCGRLSAPRPGFFLIQRQTTEGVSGPFVGHVRFDDSEDGWKIEATADLAAARFVPRHLDAIVCHAFSPPPPPEQQAADEDADPVAGDPEAAPQTHPTNIPIPYYQPITPLQSLPGATGVIYLDFDGEKGPFPGWGDFDAAPANATNTQIFEVWRRVSEDFQGFNLNITTDRRIFDQAPAGRRQQVIITPTKDAAPSAGGVAYVGSYNWSTPRPCWAFYSTGKSAAEVISHEIGHTLGLSHDGRTSPSEEYYGGHGNDPVGWAPIMGVGYSKNLTQWSKGEYLNANRAQDDLSIIANNNNNVGYRPDDYGSTLAAAGYLEILPNNSVSNEGIIERTGDIDAFRFQTTGGSVSLAINPVSHGPNLDIHAEIVNAQTLAVIVENNPLNALNASLSASLTAGEYLLRVRGTGRGDPLGDGYTNYGSLGSYLITGTVNGGVKPDRFTIAENRPNGTQVGTVVPRNNHGGAALTFAITSGNTGDAFAINPVTGAITVANGAALDFEALSSRWDIPAVIVPVVTISNEFDPALNETIRVVVNVSDVNEAPVLQAPSFVMLERTRPGTRLPTLNATDPDRFQQLSYSITGGNNDGFFRIDANTGGLTVAGLIEVPQTTTLSLTVAATDTGSPPLTTTATATITVVKHSATHQPGGIMRTFFENLSGTAVSNLTDNAKFPNNPDSEILLDSFDGGPHGDNFGSTIRGYLIAPATGTYRFRIASDDSSQLRFAANGNPSSASQIASVVGWTDRYQWNRQSSQLSSNINLTAGQLCYIEARHKEGTGGDHVAVAWTGPLNSDLQVIPGLYLAPFYQNYAPKVTTATITIRENAIPGQTVGFVTASDVNIGEIFTDFAITGGSGQGLFAMDSASGRISVAAPLDLLSPIHALTVRVTDGGSPPLQASGTVTVQITPAGAIGTSALVRQVWSSISGTAISNLTNNANYPFKPSSTRLLANGFDSGTNIADNYGSRVRGYVIPPQSGSYTFYLSSDDDGQLLLSTRANPSRATTIAQISGWAEPGNWTKYASQTSAPRSLLAGQRYYIETLQKEGGGGDHVQVAWTGPGISVPTIIPAAALEPFDINSPPVFGPASYSFAVNAASPAGTLVGTLGASDPEGDPLVFAITGGDSGGAFAIDSAGRLTLADGAELSNGPRSLTVTAQDMGLGGFYPLKSTAATVTLSITGVPDPPNQPPVFAAGPPDLPAATQDGVYSASVAGFASDPDEIHGDTLVFSKSAGPAWLEVATDGSLSGTPGNGDAGPNGFTLRVTDGGGLFAEMKLEIMVLSVLTDVNDNGIDDYWEIEKFGNADSGSNPADGDPDGDGLVNLLEFAFATDPLIPNPSLVESFLIAVNGQDYLQVSVPKNQLAGHLEFSIEFCGDLDAESWSSSVGVIIEDEPGRLTVRDSVPASSSAARFARVKVTAPPPADGK